ncbi:MAG: hypothetical protein ABSA46_00745 [Thermodesulfovibrionales bacterium]|jgi:hypothetical protein
MQGQATAVFDGQVDSYRSVFVGKHFRCVVFDRERHGTLHEPCPDGWSSRGTGYRDEVIDLKRRVLMGLASDGNESGKGTPFRTKGITEVRCLGT